MCITQALLSTYEFSLKNSRAGYTLENYREPDILSILQNVLQERDRAPWGVPRAACPRLGSRVLSVAFLMLDVSLFVSPVTSVSCDIITERTPEYTHRVCSIRYLNALSALPCHGDVARTRSTQPKRVGRSRRRRPHALQERGDPPAPPPCSRRVAALSWPGRHPSSGRLEWQAPRVCSLSDAIKRPPLDREGDRLGRRLLLAVDDAVLEPALARVLGVLGRGEGLGRVGR